MSAVAEYERHPASAIFPEMTDAGMDAIVKDMEENGFDADEFITLFEGKVLDGWNRYKCAVRAGVTPRFKQWNGRGSVAKYVQRKNLLRRHLTQSQRGIVGQGIERLLSAEIKAEKAARRKAKKEVEADGNGEADSPAEETVARNARKEAAELVKVSEGYVGHAKQIADASPEVAEAVAKGEMTIPQAMRDLGLDKPKKKPRKTSDNGHSEPADADRQEFDGQTLETIAEEHDQEKANAQDGPSDEEWLAALPVRDQLEGARLKMFDRNALAYRRAIPIVSRLKYALEHAVSKNSRKGPWIGRALSLIKMDHPQRWKLCAATTEGGCGGTGVFGGETCPTCKGAGFWIQH